MEGRFSDRRQSPSLGQFSVANKKLTSQCQGLHDTEYYHSIEGELVDVHGEEGVVHVDVAVDVDHGPSLVGAAEVIHAAVAVVSADGVGETSVEIINLIHKTVLSVERIPFVVDVKGLVLGSGDLVVIIKPESVTFPPVITFVLNRASHQTSLGMTTSKGLSSLSSQSRRTSSV